MKMNELGMPADAKARLSSGVPGLDQVLCGGLLAGFSYLVVGGAGSGKTILSLQWLLQYRNDERRPLYITLAEPAQNIRRNAGSLGWDVDCIDFVDLSPTEQPSGEGEYHVFSPSEVEQADVWNSLIEAVRERRPRALVIDSVTQLGYLSTDDYQFRKQILALVAFLNRIGCTAYLLYEPAMLDREASAGLAVDGIIRLTRTISPGLALGLRSVEVEKLRGSDFASGRHPLAIGGDGITVYPHLIETLGDHRVGESGIDSGVAELDELLGGGIDSGTSLLLSGPTGVGKSTLGLQMLVRAAQGGMKGVLYAFEESEQLIRRRCDAVGVPVSRMIDSGMIRIERVNPLQLYPDQLLAMARRDVEQEGRGIVMVDSLRGYELAMEEFGMAQAHVHNLVSYLTRNGVTTVLVSEVEHITGADLRATELGVSHLADNIMLLRYAEYEGRIIKVISCLKKRSGNFQPELREYAITSQGIRVGQRLQNLRGVLSGVPMERAAVA
jgi:circadian clock protein KaiC